MATENKAPTKAEVLEALSKNGINTLEDLVDAIMPETGGFNMDEMVNDYELFTDPLSIFKIVVRPYRGIDGYSDEIPT